MKTRVALVSAALFLLPSMAAAVPTFSLISPATITVAVGQSFTIDVALDNPGGTVVQGVDVTLDGLVAAGANVTAGESARYHFVGFCQPTMCFGGIDSIDNQFFDPSDLSGGIYSPGSDSVGIVSALAFAPTSNAGTIDPGLDGADFAVPSARDVSIDLMAMTAGTHVLTIAGEYSTGSTLLPVVGTTITVTVPEPGAMMSSLASLGSVLVVVGLRRRRL